MNMDEKEIVRIKQRAEEELLKIPGVHAVGIGAKDVAGKPTGEICIKVFVVRKKFLGDIPPDERIPPEIDGVATDVYEVPPPTTLQVPGSRPPSPGTPYSGDEERYRPLRGGVQINRVGQGQGTMGFFFTVEGSPGLILGVTNHHVVYNNCTDPTQTEAVGQPMESDSCTDCCSSVVGRVFRAVCDANLDIALIQLNGGQQWLAEVQQMGFIAGGSFVSAADAASGTFQVKKRGRTTLLTGGVVHTVEISGTVMKPDLVTVHRNYQHAMQIRANPDSAGTGTDFGAGGDSGSAVVAEASGRVVGLLFAAGGGEGWAIPLDLIMAQFDMLPGAQRLQLRVASATTNNDVRVVPRVAAELERPPSEVPAEDQAFVPQLEFDLGRSAVGRWYIDAYLRHAREVRELINQNRKVATIWHRSGAAELFQSLVQITRRSDARVPEVVQGLPLTDILRQMGNILAQYGTVELRRDLALAEPSLPSVAGLTYAEILERLDALNTVNSIA